MKLQKVGNIIPVLVEYYIEQKVSSDLAMLFALFTFGLFISLGAMVPGYLVSLIFGFSASALFVTPMIFSFMILCVYIAHKVDKFYGR